jgi:ubiquinone/menaquinone biosynthesis C-methylase UbiE
MFSIEERNIYWEKRFKKFGLIYGKEPSIAIKEIAPYLKKGDKILFIAEGYGRNAAWLAKRGFKEIICTDVSKEAIKKAKKLYKEIPSLKFEVKDALKLDYPQNSIDAVISIYGLNVFRLKEVEKVFENVSKILKPGGKFCNTFLSIDDDEYGRGKIIEENTFLYEDGQLVKFFTLKEIEELHQKFGFKIEKIEKMEETRKIHKETLTSRYFLVLSRKI